MGDTQVKCAIFESAHKVVQLLASFCWFHVACFKAGFHFNNSQGFFFTWGHHKHGQVWQLSKDHMILTPFQHPIAKDL